MDKSTTIFLALCLLFGWCLLLPLYREQMRATREQIKRWQEMLKEFDGATSRIQEKIELIVALEQQIERERT